MLPKDSRLNLVKPINRRIFKEDFKQSNHFKLYYRQSLSNDFKAAVVIPVKIINKAAHRNKLRRLLYSTIETHSIKNCGLELVVMMIKKPVKNEKRLKEELGVLLNKLI